MKYKLINKEQVLISLDRLTRFKNTKEKYLRVFTDILVNCLIEPKLKKSELLCMDYAELTSWTSDILNESIKALTMNNKSACEDLCLNKLLKDYENAVFINDFETQKLLNNNILYTEAVDLINEDCVFNLKWLKMLANAQNCDLIKLREDNELKYPIEKIVLAEGITEEILLPAFSRYLGFDFYKKGIQIIPAGGKNQVVKMYYKLIEEVRLPIFVLLDNDAEKNIAQIRPKLRKIDKIHLISCGEFEDLLPKSLIVKTVNKHFENFLSISEQDLVSEYSTVHVLDELFKTKGLHEFKKADFAKLVRDNIACDSDISDEIKDIIIELKA